MKSFTTLMEDLSEGAAEQEIATEGLSLMGRKKLKRAAKRNRKKLQIGRKKAKFKRATPAVLKKRAARRARAAMKKKLFGNTTGKKLSNSALNKMQNMVNARSGQLDDLRRRMVKVGISDNRKKK